MAKTPKFYPSLKRDKTVNKTGIRRGAIQSNVPVRVPRIIQANSIFKPTKVENKNFLAVNTMAIVGNNIKSGTKNPSWRVTIAKKGDATSNYGRDIYQVRPTQYRVRAESLNWLSNGVGTLSGGTVISEANQTALNDLAIGRLRNKLQGKVGNAELAAPLAESREIHRLVRQINGLGMSALRAMLAAKKSKGKSVSKELANIWLGLGFGLNPLLSDLEKAAKSILEYVTRADRTVVITGTAHQEYFSTTQAISGSEFIAQDANIGFDRCTRHTQSIRYVAGVDLQIGAGSNYGVLDHLGLKLGALPSTLWELTPFSWVVDYGSTVGSWLEDAFYTVPGRILYVSKNYRYQSECVATPRVFYTAGTSGVFSGTQSVGRFTNFDRTSLAQQLPVRSLRIKSVDEIAMHGLNKMLNLASVLAGGYGPNLNDGALRPRRWRPG